MVQCGCVSVAVAQTYSVAVEVWLAVPVTVEVRPCLWKCRRDRGCGRGCGRGVDVTWALAIMPFLWQ